MKSIGIIGGKGKMGAFFAEVFLRHGMKVSVWSREDNVSLEDFCKTPDIIMVSVPMDKTKEIISKIGEYLQPHQCIIDVTSLKKFPMEAMQKTGKKYFGMHPMFAPTLSGKMEGQNVVMCSGNAPEEESFIRTIFEAEGAFLLDMTPEAHDELMSVVQGLSHFLDISFIQTLKARNINLENIFAARSPAYALKMMLASRTLAQDANLYGNIQILNPINVETLKTFFLEAEKLAKTIEEKSLSDFSEIFHNQQKYLGKYAEISQSESDIVIDFLANRILKKQHPTSFHAENHPNATIGILGPQNTFSHIAAQEFFPETSGFKMYPTISAVFTAYKNKEISEIFVPIENILHGTVAESIDGITKTNLPIRAMYEMKIVPALFVSEKTNPENIIEIFSHPQPLAQCSDYLENNFPKVHITSVASTAIAMEKMLATPHSAAVAPLKQGEVLGVKTIATNIANQSNNATRFAYLSEKTYPKTSKNIQGGFLFSFSSDAPGSLENVLHLFSKNKINLTKIESRPTGNAFGEYIFLVTYEGTIQNIELFKKELEKHTAFIRFLGEFGIFTK